MNIKKWLTHKCKCGKYISAKAKMCINCYGNKNIKIKLTKQFLYKNYILENKSLQEIADIVGYKGAPSILFWLKKYNIKSRPSGFIGHKPDCKCGVCKARRGETKGENNANFKHNKIRNHKCKDCRKNIDIRSIRCRKCFQKRFKQVICKRKSFRKKISIANLGSKGVSGNKIVKHHKDLNRKNNTMGNILSLRHKTHTSLHSRAYRYLVTTGQIEEYIKWFFKQKRLT